MIWHAIRVMEGSERTVQHKIRSLALPALPLELVDGPRMSARLVPLIPEYLFLGFVAAPDWLAIRRIKGVIGPLAMRRDDQPHAFPGDEIHALQALSIQLIHEYLADAAATKRPQTRRRPRKSRRAFPKVMQESLDAMPIAVTAFAAIDSRAA
jgi:transcription antitermination factor NusG